ncbi:MAG: CPBP family intramembrane glutamic endopeptidase [Pseudomonadota bacterium]
MFSGPYNTPLALARSPFAAVFWPLIAPILFLNIGVVLAGLFTFGWAFEQFEDGGSLQNQWLILAVVQIALFAAMSLWSERVGAGPFAGSLALDGDWLAISALTGPVILLGTTILVGLLVGNGDPNWMFRDEQAHPQLGAGAIGLSMVAATVLLVPLTEEMAYRGVAVGFLLGRGVPPLLGGVVTSAVFAATHLQYSLFGMVPIFIMGLYLAWLRVATGTVSAPIAAHMSANAISMALFITTNQP